LVSTSQNLDIEISGDIFDKNTTIRDLQKYKEWRTKSLQTLKELEEELDE
jgi:hypothetical protein